MRKKKTEPPAPGGGGGLGGCISLTMSYFHTGIRTIIGAEAFHFPVRDGKEWDHLAMVVRLDFSPHAAACRTIHRAESAGLRPAWHKTQTRSRQLALLLVRVIGSSLTSN